MLTVLLACVSSGAEAGVFATSVTEFDPGPNATMDTDLILGGPMGNGDYFGGTHTLSLGVSGSVTVKFSAFVQNGPGDDLIVFENAFFFYNDPQQSFAELAFVEVSSDGVNFARFPAASATPQPVGSFGTIDPADVSNLAGARPVYANVEINSLDPFDPNVGGGDGFDLEDLTLDPMVTSGQVDLMAIRYVRIQDILGNGSVVDAAGNPIYDATTPGEMSNSADIDAVAAIYPSPIAAVQSTFGGIKALYADRSQ